MQAIDYSFVTIIKPINNKIGKTSPEGLKCVNFPRKMDKKRLQKPAIFSKPSKHFIIELAQGKSTPIMFNLIFGIGNFELISSEL